MGSTSSSESTKSAQAPLAEGEHFVRRGNFYRGKLPPHLRKAVFAAGCFWGTEKSFWRLPGVYSTAVVYIGGRTENPTYRQVCSGASGHAEATLVVYDPSLISLADLLRNFLRCHNPTQGNRQGRDCGSQYRSGLYLDNADDEAVARAALAAFQGPLTKAGFGKITTEVRGDDPTIWYAETYHQQYLAKPGNRQYCSAEPTGVKLPDFSQWPELSEAQKEKYAPHLPPAFWATYDGSIRAPHAPATWKDSKKAEQRALEAARQSQEEFATELAEAERASDVVLQYCGGCGFGQRADELATYLEQALGCKVAKVQDRTTTGRFTVRVRSQPNGGGAGAGGGSFQVVHSKTGGDKPSGSAASDGFVDSEAKLEGIMRALVKGGVVTAAAVEDALKAGRSGTTPFPPGVSSSPASAGGGGASAPVSGPAAVVDFWTNSLPAGRVALFAKTTCGFCRRAVASLEEGGFAPFVVDVDRRADGSAVLAEVQARTGHTTVPVVFVADSDGPTARFVGGNSELVKELEAGALDAAALALMSEKDANARSWAQTLTAESNTQLRDGLRLDGSASDWLQQLGSTDKARSPLEVVVFSKSNKY